MNLIVCRNGMETTQLFSFESEQNTLVQADEHEDAVAVTPQSYVTFRDWPIEMERNRRAT